MIAEEIGDDVRHVEVELPTQIFYRVHKLSGYTYIMMDKGLYSSPQQQRNSNLNIRIRMVTHTPHNPPKNPTNTTF
jgi:hypothetical protein